MDTAVDRLVSNGNSIINFLKEFSEDTPKDISIGWIEDDGSVTQKSFANIAKFQGAINSAFEKPNPNIVLFEKLTHASFKIPSGFKVKVGITVVQTVSDYTVVVNAPIPGTDYKVFAKTDGSFYADTTNQGTDRLIGGFHYGLIPANEAPTGNKTEADMVRIRGINAYSFWDLKFKSIAGNDGMVLVGNKWIDIYLLNSEHIENGTSKAGLQIAGGAVTNGRAIPKIPLIYGGDGTLTYGKMDWIQTNLIAKAYGKELISHDEFVASMFGVQKNISSNGIEEVVGKIEHYPKLTSKFGIEQATGTQWTWGKNAWGGNAVVLGGNRDDGASSSSLYVNWSFATTLSAWHSGSRFACNHLKLV